MECPEWMNAEFFDEVIQKREDLQGKKYTISGISCSEVVGTGDNYVSVMYRANVEVEVEGGKEKIVDSFIVKSMENTMEMFKDYGIFPKEVEAYHMVIPECEKFWKDAGYVVEFGPKCLKATTGGQEVLVLSDLKRDGYVMMDRFKGLDLKCAEMTFEKLAKFHAASIAYKEKVTNIPEHLDRDFIDDTFEEMYKSYGDSSIICLADILEKNNFDQKYVNKIRRLPKILLDELKIIGGPKRTPDELQCLVHGDLWMNNQMYKLDEQGKPTELIFIDFQIMYWGRPITDILYFLISSVRPDIVIENFDYLFKYYHDHLVKSMKILGVKQKPPTLKNFRIELQKYGFFVCNCMVEILPVVLMDRTELSTMENFFDEGENGQKLKTLTYSNPRYLEVMSKYLPFFDNKGFLDSDFNPDDEELKSDLPLQETKTIELKCPEWMNAEFFHDIYKNDKALQSKTYTIVDIICCTACEVGDNYTSKVYGAKVILEVEGRDKKVDNYVLKEIDDSSESLKDINIFGIELEAFQVAVPGCENVWNKAGHSIQFGPKLLKHTSDEHKVFVMSDLKDDGFIMLDRFKGLDLDEAKLGLDKLAKFQAASIAYKERYGDFPPNLSRKFIDSSHEEGYLSYLQVNVNSLISAISKTKTDSLIIDKVKKWPKMLVEELKMLTDLENSPNDLQALTHADLNINNMMYKFDENGKAADVVFLDFQYMYWGRSVTDVIYFLISSVRPEIVVEHFDYFLNYFHLNLVKSCDILGVKRDIPSLKDYLVQITKYGSYVCTALVEILPPTLMERNELANLDNLFNDDDVGRQMRDMMFFNPKYLEALSLYLPFFDNKGFLDPTSTNNEIENQIVFKGTPIERPKWITDGFFDEIYEKREDFKISNYSIVDISCTSVVDVGDNFSSKIYRANVTLEVKGGSDKVVDSYVLKEIDNSSERLKNSNIFQMELDAYQVAIEGCESIWKKERHSIQFGPRLLKYNKENQVFVMSDLREEGYVMLNRLKGLDLEQTKVALKKLAKFQTASIAYKERFGDYPSNLSRKYYEPSYEEFYISYYQTNVNSLISAISTTDMDTSIIEKVKKWPKMLVKELEKLTDLENSPNDLQALTHADLNINNMMYKFDENGKAVDVVFLDFQYMYWGRSVTDVIYFLISSVRPEIVVEHFDYLLNYFHVNLVKSCDILGVKREIPSLKDYLVQITKYGSYACIALIEVLPPLLMDRNELVSLESLMKNDENGNNIRSTMLSNQKYLNALRLYMPFFDQRGFLDSDYGQCYENNHLNIENVSNRSSDLDWPQWMTGEFFDEIYEKREELKDKKYKINVVSCGNVVDIGDNYLSKLYRTKVEVEVEGSDKKMEESFIIKSVETTDPMIAEYKVYANEKEAYTDAIPAITQFWEDIGETIDFGPKCLKATAEPHDIMVLTDLKQSGYIMLNRFEGVDLEHAKMTLRKLAKFHAGSLLYKEKNGSFGPMLSRKYMAENYTEMFDQYTKAAIEAVVKNLERNNFDPKILNKIKNWHKSDFKEILHIFDPDSDYIDLSVLIHGDLWLNNQLFKYDENKKLKDVIFVDFQICYWGRPATDIFYFLVSSVKPEIVIPNFNSLLEEYYNELVSSCEKLDVNRKLPTFENFLDEINKCGYIGGTLLFEIVPVVLMEKNENAKIENFMNDSEGGKIMKDKMYNNPKYLRVLESYLSYFDKMGYLDLNIPETDKIEADIGEVPVTNGELNGFSN